VPFDSALASVIDHTCLRPDAVGDEIDRLCDEALAFQFRTVCVQPVFVARAARRLAGTGVGVAAVVAFPHGVITTDAKLFEARRALDDGATELDVVANLGWIRGGDAARLTAETAAIVEVTAAAGAGALVKVILETAMFPEHQKLAAAQAVMKGHPAFLKTSTGFGPGGATLADVALLRRVAGTQAHVKASGGIRTRADALAMRAAGADRLGASASAALVALDSAASV
jgi:deoxyribose-phosphate aldolase